MSKDILVTVLTPCYNGEKYLDKYFNSILKQDYDNIQLILVNDGSTDKTVEIVEKYRPILEAELTEFMFITQENQGQAGACKNALPKVKGKYLIWPDVDDVLTENAISYKVNFLENNPQFAYCMAQAQCFDGKITQKGRIFKRENQSQNDLFEDFITQKDVYYCPGVYMINFDLYKKANPNLDFYVGRGGQNWQMLLPISHNNKCGFIDEVQYYYLVHPDSHSHSNNTYKKEYDYSVNQEKIIRETLKILDLTYDEKSYYDRIISKKYAYLHFEFSWKYNDKSYKENYKILKKYGASKASKIKYLLMKYAGTNVLTPSAIIRGIIGNLLPLKNIVLFESVPVFSDNTKYVYKELVKREEFKNYKFIWIVGKGDNVDFKAFDVDKNTKFFKYGTSKWYMLKKKYLLNVAKVLICSNGFLKKAKRDQYCIFLAHGTALKNCSSKYNVPNYVDDITCISSNLKKYDAINDKCDESKLQPLGFARNDLLFGKPVDLKELFNTNENTKYIYWMPTFRQHRNSGNSYSSISFPIIYSVDDAKAINECAKQNNVMVIVKPHPSQDMSLISEVKLDNLIFIDNEFLRKSGVDNYELLRSVDSMITDYSSVYYDYMLCDKPIGLTFDDFDEYNEKEGFTVDPDYIFSAGEKIYNVDDLCEFITRISNEEDLLKNERAKLIDYCHDNKDGTSTKKIVDFIIEKAIK